VPAATGSQDAVVAVVTDKQSMVDMLSRVAREAGGEAPCFAIMDSSDWVRLYQVSKVKPRIRRKRAFGDRRRQPWKPMCQMLAEKRMKRWRL